MASGEVVKQEIIPYQELPGNYNHSPHQDSAARIIPYQELPGNYNPVPEKDTGDSIIPYQELPGRGCLQQRTGQRRIGEMSLFRLLYPDG